MVNKLKRGGFSLIYSNTIVNGDVLQSLADIGAPVITHVHELEHVIGQFGVHWQAAKHHSNAFIAASHAVKNNLLLNHDIAEQSIHVVHESVPFAADNSPNQGATTAELLPAGPLVVCGCGTIEWRKGTDLFVALAGEVRKQLLPGEIQFVWIGGHHSEKEKNDVLKLVEKLGVSEYLTFTGSVDDPRKYFRTASAFAMVSREDPFPLVCLEAASVGLPILCFAECGGMPEFVEEDAGYVVPNGDVKRMATCIFNLYEKPELGKSLGQSAKAKFESRFSHDVHCEKIMNIIQDQIDQAAL